MKNINLLLILITISFFTACGGGSDSGDSFEGTSSDVVDLTSTVSRFTEFFGAGGNLYKPSSDPHGSGGGNMVVLLDASYSTRFDTCEIPLNTGEVAQLHCIDTEEWTQIPFSCFSNGNRQTWRGDFKCSSVGEITVTCRDSGREVVFTVPDEVKGHICTRFG